VVSCSWNVIFNKWHKKDLFEKITSLHINFYVHFYVEFCEWNNSEFLITNNGNRNDAQPVRTRIHFQRFLEFTAITSFGPSDKCNADWYRWIPLWIYKLKCNTNTDTYKLFPDLALTLHLWRLGGGGLWNS
jgi:hypothetical protein